HHPYLHRHLPGAASAAWTVSEGFPQLRARVYNVGMATPHPAALRSARRGILDLSSDELLAWLQVRGEKKMRARQVRRWIVAGRAESYEGMTDLPRGLRAALETEFQPLGTAVAHHAASPDGTHKLVLRLSDNQLIECVLIQEAGRHTACVSTQVGCG